MKQALKEMTSINPYQKFLLALCICAFVAHGALFGLYLAETRPSWLVESP